MFGAAQFAMIAAAGGAIVALVDQVVLGQATTPADATASYSLNNSGAISHSGGSGGFWVNPASAAGAAFECRFTVTSGSLTTGTSGSWLALSTTRTWTVVRTSNVVGTTSCVGTLEIRRAADGVVLTSATITLNAEVEA